MRYAVPNTPGSVLTLKPRYGNYIGGEFVPPVKGRCFTDTSPVNGSVIDEFPHSSAADIYKALDAAHAAAVRQERPDAPRNRCAETLGRAGSGLGTALGIRRADPAHGS